MATKVETTAIIADSPLPVRMKEVRAGLHRAAALSGIDKADIVRMAVAAFLSAHPKAEDVIAASIKYRAALNKRAAA